MYLFSTPKSSNTGTSSEKCDSNYRSPSTSSSTSTSGTFVSPDTSMSTSPCGTFVSPVTSSSTSTVGTFVSPVTSSSTDSNRRIGTGWLGETNQPDALNYTRSSSSLSRKHSRSVK